MYLAAMEQLFKMTEIETELSLVRKTGWRWRTCGHDMMWLLPP